LERIGLELSIRGTQDLIEKVAMIADTGNVDYYFVPETHPKFFGVNAFLALKRIIPNIKNLTVGTAIVNVFSRSEKCILKSASNIYRATNENFILGIGTSHPKIVEDMYEVKFERPISRIIKYTKYLRARYNGPIYWAAVGDKMVELAGQYADGVIFFLLPESEVNRKVRILKNKLGSINKNRNNFEIISILPTYISDSNKRSKNSLRHTLASYIGANGFYSKPLERVGFSKEVRKIRENLKYGLDAAAIEVSDKLLEALVIYGDPMECSSAIRKFSATTGVKTIIAGFDLFTEGSNEDFLKNLERFVAIV
jgi:alkanesulfonate monooxygenase SsuD/methylene tetrahydromethanopterin reductase-like flavin-dependent oxidoreductase (luciferase family)